MWIKDWACLGRCDYILSQSADQYALTTPVLMLVKAKNDNIKSGIAQCAAEIFAAQQYHQQKNNPMECIYGCISSGTQWKFLKLKKHQLFIDLEGYYTHTRQKLHFLLYQVCRK